MEFAQYVAGELKKYVTKKPRLLSKNIPKHIGIIATEEADNGRRILAIKNIIKTYISCGVPYLSFYITPKNIEEITFLRQSAFLRELFKNLQKWELIDDHQIKISVIGDWYSLASDIIDSIRRISNKTRKNEKTMIQFFVNYDGRKEISDAVRLIVKQVQFGKVSLESIRPDHISSAIASSNFSKPDLIFLPHTNKRMGFMLWQAEDTPAFFTTKSLVDLERLDLFRAIEVYQRSK